MKIIFSQAEQIKIFMNNAYDAFDIPQYVSYDYVTTALKSADDIDEKLFEMNKDIYINSKSVYIMLDNRKKSLEEDIAIQQQAIKNYEKFDIYYQKSKVIIQSFEIK